MWLLRSSPPLFLNASALGELMASPRKIQCLQLPLNLGQDLRRRSGPKVPDFVGQLPMTLLVEVLGPDDGELVLRFDVVNDDRAVLNKLMTKKHLGAM